MFIVVDATCDVKDYLIRAENSLPGANRPHVADARPSDVLIVMAYYGKQCFHEYSDLLFLCSVFVVPTAKER